MWSEYPEISKELLLVDKLIKENISSRSRFFSEVVNELVDSGGKRLRPAFVITAAKFGKYSRKKVLSMAGALEILHTATLVHDDIIDSSKLRRGKATISEKHGIDMAVYSGDYLFTKAVLMLSNDVPVKRLDVVARAVKTICEGEVDQYRDRYNSGTTVISYLKRISRKTAVLFGAACGLGAYSAGCTADMGKNLARFGLYYGIAFQIRDDLKDFLSDTGCEGKPVAKDIKEGVYTLPVIYALNNDAAFRKQFNALAEKKDNISDTELMWVMSEVKRHGGLKASEIMLEKYVDRGLKALGKLPDNQYRSIFDKLIKNLL